VSRLRFVTHDPELFVKEEVIPYDVTQHPVEPQPNAPPAASPGRITNAMEIEYRVLPYINAMPEALQYCNGSAAALNVCNKLFEFGLDKETARQVFTAYYNPRCKPPWSDYEIDHKLDTAYSKPLKPAGCMLDDSQVTDTTCRDEQTKIGQPSSKNQRIKLTRFDEIEDRPVEWYMHNKIPAYDLTVISGDGGVGKTYIACKFAAHTTAGTPWADGTPCKMGNVIIFPPEGQKAALKRRLIANGADLSKCWLLEGRMSYDAKTGTHWVDIINLEDITWIAEAIDEAERDSGKPVVLVIIDPVGNHAGRGDSYKDTDVRRMLAPLQRLADEKKVTFLLVAHHNKAEHSSAQKKVMGSGAWVNIARAHWVVSVDKEDKDLRYFAPSKYNDCKDPKAIAYRIVSQPGQWEGQVQIESMDIDKTASDFMQEQRQIGQRGRTPVKRDAAVEWLLDYLADGEKNETEIKAAGAAKGFSDSTIDRAKGELHIFVIKDSSGKWKWKLQGDGRRKKWGRD
jgi:KaiC/GvpD/RAD55 family RecA-like ATPase